MASVEEFVVRITSNREKIVRYAWILQLFAGLVLLGVSHLMGHTHFHLIREGVRAPGRIVGYKQESFRFSSGSSSTSFMPIVEFHINDAFVQFQDCMGTSIAGSPTVPALVLFDPPNPPLPIADRP